MTGTGTYFFPGDPPCLLIRRAVEQAELTVEKLVRIVCTRVEALAARFPELKHPLADLLCDIYADAGPAKSVT
ncbi:MAG: hypothetical protein K2Q23_00395 [Bryobacteraceae bacterium]|nr:hypothetical protein [Bryobacteraceae bacterium]